MLGLVEPEDWGAREAMYRSLDERHGRPGVPPFCADAAPSKPKPVMAMSQAFHDCPFHATVPRLDR
jgi:hypothetical protein